MGTVYLAWDPKLERQLAVKLLKENDPELRERFEREAIAAARLRHPHIVTIYDVGEHDGQPFIAMEYIGGQTLADAIRERQPLSIVRKLELIGQMCDGLGFAHRTGIVHRDVKPANMMVDASGSLKILDFGIARIAESASMTQAGTMMGTLNYMSPEQVTGQTVDQRSDIFAVGAVLYELVCYQQAFPGTLSTGVLNRILNEQPRPLVDVDPEIARIVTRATEKDPARRYQDLAAMERELQAIRFALQGQTPVSGPIGAGTYVGQTPRPGSRDELLRRRQVQIEGHLALAAQALAVEDYEGVIAACDDVRLLNADEPRALDLISRAQAGLDQRQVNAWLAEAQEGLQRGAFTAARELIDRAATLTPGSSRVAELRQALTEAVRVRDEARRRQQERQNLLARAESSLDLGHFDEAMTAADELLAAEPEHAGARVIKAKAEDGLLAQARAREAEAGRRAREAAEQAESQLRARDDVAEAAPTLAVPLPADSTPSAAASGGTVLIARADSGSYRRDTGTITAGSQPAVAGADQTFAPAGRASAAAVESRAPVTRERPRYLVPALVAGAVVVIGGFSVYRFSSSGDVEPPPAEPMVVARNPEPMPPPEPAPAPPEPPPAEPTSGPSTEAWQRAESAAAAARRSAEAAGEAVVATPSYRQARTQDQEAATAFRDGRVADAISASRRAAALYAQAIREMPSRPREPVRAGADVPAPRLMKSVDPVYPAAALAGRVAGSVGVEALIDAAGRVTSVKVVRSVQALDQAALDAVRQWEFAPTMVAGRAVSVVHTVDVPFTPPPEPIVKATLPPPTTPPTTLPPAAAPVDESAAVRATIRALANAYNDLNVDAVLAIHPSASRSGLEKMRESLESQRVEITGEKVTVSGTRATLMCTWTVTSRPKNTRGDQRDSRVATFQLEKKGSSWYVVSRR